MQQVSCPSYAQFDVRNVTGLGMFDRVCNQESHTPRLQRLQA